MRGETLGKNVGGPAEMPLSDFVNNPEGLTDSAPQIDFAHELERWSGKCQIVQRVLKRSRLCSVPFCRRIDVFVQNFSWETQSADINSRSDFHRI